MSDAAFETSGSSTSTPSTKVMAKVNLAQASINSSCSICNKRVYDMEKIAIDQQVIFHKNCFRCSQCKGILSVRNYTMAEGELFCKQHYLRQFKEVGGKYNFTGSQTTPSRSTEVRTEALASPSVRSPASATRNDSGIVDTPRPAKSWQLTSNNSVETPRDGPPPMVELVRSPTGLGPSGAGVASIRSMFENPSRGDKVEQRKVTSPVVQDEVSVISLMKNQSSVKSRRAQFSGTSVYQDNNEIENEHIGSSSTSNERHLYDDVILPQPAIRTAAPPQQPEEEEVEEPQQLEEEEVEDIDPVPHHVELKQHDDGQEEEFEDTESVQHHVELKQHDDGHNYRDEQEVGHRNDSDEEYENEYENVDRNAFGDGHYYGQKYNNDDQIEDDCNGRDGNWHDGTYLNKNNGHAAAEEVEETDHQHDYEQQHHQELNDDGENPDDDYVYPN